MDKNKTPEVNNLETNDKEIIDTNAADKNNIDTAEKNNIIDNKDDKNLKGKEDLTNNNKDDKQNGEKLFTQTEVNDIIKKRLEDRNNPLESELESLKDTVEAMKAQTEQIAYEKKVLKIESILKDNNVREDRIESLIKLKGLDEAEEDNLELLISESIQEFPEFINSSEGKGTGFRIATDPTGETSTMTLKEFNSLSYLERMEIKKNQPHIFNKIMNK